MPKIYAQNLTHLKKLPSCCRRCWFYRAFKKPEDREYAIGKCAGTLYVERLIKKPTRVTKERSAWCPLVEREEQAND